MFKSFVRRSAKRLGYEITGYPRAYAAHRSLNGLLRQQEINLVLDVGANTGQFVDELRTSGYSGRIISFEPQVTAHASLRQRAQTDPNWVIAERAAIGAEDGVLEMNISGNSVSSSLLEMLPSHSAAEPSSSYVAKESVAVKRLDDLYKASEGDRILLKIDVQGYEGPVLDGATRTLAEAKAIIAEMSLVPLYADQMLARDLWDRLAAAGFEPWSLEPGFRDPSSGRMLQLDGLFIRRYND